MNNTIDMLIKIIENIELYRLQEYDGERRRKLYIALGEICKALQIIIELEEK